ncbi:VI_minor_4, type VI secretion-associated protein, BMA_A0400 family [Rhabdaerophilaceae bacterium]
MMFVRGAAIGLFGKIPSQGDFFQRDLPLTFVRPWDEWLSRGMVASQAALGDNWAQTYLLSPPWRFQLAPGLCGESGWVGVLVASIDRVNRFYPVTLALPFLPGGQPSFMTDLRGTLDRLEAAAFALIDAQKPMDTILSETQAGVEAEHEAQRALVTQRFTWIENAEQRAWMAFGDQQGTPLMPAGPMMTGLGRDASSLWWHEFWEPHPPTTLLCRGLPPEDSFAMLLDSQWRHSSLFAMAPG